LEGGLKGFIDYKINLKKIQSILIIYFEFKGTERVISIDLPFIRTTL